MFKNLTISQQKQKTCELSILLKDFYWRMPTEPLLFYILLVLFKIYTNLHHDKVTTQAIFRLYLWTVKTHNSICCRNLLIQDIYVLTVFTNNLYPFVNVVQIVWCYVIYYKQTFLSCIRPYKATCWWKVHFVMDIYWQKLCKWDVSQNYLYKTKVKILLSILILVIL